MRIPAEPVNNRFVPELEVEVVLDAVFAEQSLGDLVDQPGFAVHEWHVQKHALCGRERLIHPQRNGLLSQGQCHRVGCERHRTVSVEISGKLIKDDDFRQPPSGFNAPFKELPAHRAVVKLGESTPDQLVKGGVCLPMLRG